MKLVALKPKLSEKTYGLSQTSNTYTFDVPKLANKHDIARAIAAQFDVTVTDVRITTIPGKTKRSVRKGGRRVVRGKRNDTRKAYVSLASGNTLPIFSAVEEAGNTMEESK